MKKAHVNKILAAFIAVALVASVFVFSSSEETIVKAYPPTTTPGVNDFGNATTDLEYGQTIKPKINTTGMSAGTYYLYKPAYNCSGTGSRNAQRLTWYEQVETTETYVAATLTVTTPGDLVFLNEPIYLDRAGMWVFDSDPPVIDGNDSSSFDAFFWVNTTDALDITTVNPFDYGSNTSKTITVKQDGDAPDQAVFIDLIAPDGTTVFHKYDADGVYTFKTYGNITMAGNYTIRSYADLDEYSSKAYLYYDEGTGEGYDETYGTMFGSSLNATLISAGDHWNYSICGPWDPPEINATEKKFRVRPGTPALSIPDANKTMYHSFDGEVNISIKDTSGDPIAAADYEVAIYNDDDDDVSSNFSYGDYGHQAGAGGNITKYDGYCLINMTAWGMNGTEEVGNNGTWFVYIYVDSNGDRTADKVSQWFEEWNGTISWRVRSAPGAQFKWIDDDGSVSSVNNDGVLPKIPAIASLPVNVQFQIIGDDHTYFGASDEQSAKENISISGNALFTGTLDEVPGASYSGGTWTIPVIPTMSQGGGSISIVATWEDYGSISQILSIGGTNYVKNGTIVSVTPNEFTIGTDQTFTVTMKYADGTPISYGTAELYYIDDGDVASAGDPLQGHKITADDVGPDYTLGFNNTQQRDNQTEATFPSVKAPRNLTVYAKAYVGSKAVYGYARIYMKASSDLKVTFEAIASPATNTLFAGQEYEHFYINISKVDAAGNASGKPESDDYDEITVRIIDEDGKIVTLPLGSIDSLAASDMGSDYVFHFDNNEYIDIPGTYTVYAKNYTSDSTGNNATIYVKQAHVECDKAPFIWSYDDNISATFTVTNGITGELVEGGTLIIENMSWTDGTYNKTWTNTSDSGNNTIELDEGEGFTNGRVTVHDITANYLPPGASEAYITFKYKPEDGEEARASGMVKIQVPTVRFDAPAGDPDAKTIKYARVGTYTDIFAYATGRDNALLSDIYVGLEGQGISLNGTTGSVGTDKGMVTLTINPDTTGNITVDVGEYGRTVKTPVVIATSWQLSVSAPVQVMELESFTVTVTKKGTTDPVVGATVEVTGLGTGTTDANGEVDFTTVDVTSDRTYDIIATADGYSSDSIKKITVINQPRIYMSLPDDAVVGTAFTITAGGDDGNNNGITVTITKGSKTKTGVTVNGVVSFTVDTAGDWTATATKTGYISAAADTFEVASGSPGFELLTLIIAIGVAYILLKRRRQ